MRGHERTVEAHAPAAHQLERAPLMGADDYSTAPTRVLVDAWAYEAAQDVADGSPLIAAWWASRADTTGMAGVAQQRGIARRAVRVRSVAGAAQ